MPPRPATPAVQRFKREHYEYLIEWLENPENFAAWTGAGKTKVGGNNKTKVTVAAELAAKLAASRRIKEKIVLDGTKMKARLEAYIAKFKEQYKKECGTGYGVTDADRALGHNTVQQVAENACPFYSRMRVIFGERDNINPAAIMEAGRVDGVRHASRTRDTDPAGNRAADAAPSTAASTAASLAASPAQGAERTLAADVVDADPGALDDTSSDRDAVGDDCIDERNHDDGSDADGFTLPNTFDDSINDLHETLRLRRTAGSNNGNRSGNRRRRRSVSPPASFDNLRPGLLSLPIDSPSEASKTKRARTTPSSVSGLDAYVQVMGRYVDLQREIRLEDGGARKEKLEWEREKWKLEREERRRDREEVLAREREDRAITLARERISLAKCLMEQKGMTWDRALVNVDELLSQSQK